MLKKLAKLKIILLLATVVFLISKIDSFKEVLLSHDAHTENHGVVLSTNNNKNNVGTDQSLSKKIGLAVLNLGMIQDISTSALSTDHNVAIGFSIYSDSLTNACQNSLKQGRETMIYIPTQTINSESYDPGPLAMFTDDSVQENAQKLTNILTKSNHDIGLYLEPHSVFSVEENKVSFLLKQLENHENDFKFFVYYDKDGSNFFTKLSAASFIKYKTVVATHIIDEILSEQEIKSVLESMIESQDIPLGIIVSPTEFTLKILSKWLSINADKVEIVSISEILELHSKEMK